MGESRIDEDRLDKVYKAAESDLEYQVLDELMERAGLTWKCGCGFANPSSEDRCDGCGKVREK